MTSSGVISERKCHFCFGLYFPKYVSPTYRLRTISQVTRSSGLTVRASQRASGQDLTLAKGLQTLDISKSEQVCIHEYGLKEAYLITRTRPFSNSSASSPICLLTRRRAPRVLWSKRVSHCLSHSDCDKILKPTDVWMCSWEQPV